MSGAEEAAAAWIDAALDGGRVIPRPSSAQAILDKGDFSGWMVGYVNIDPALLDDTIERVNVTLSRRVLMRLDARAKEAGQNRSDYIGHMAAIG